MQNVDVCHIRRQGDGRKPHAIPVAGSRSLTNLGRFMSRLRHDQAGAVSALAGVTMVAFLGVVGLAVEAGYWYVDNRQGQNGADVAAVAGAMTLAKSNNHTSTLLAGANGAARNGFVPGGKSTVTINHPPLSGKYTTNNYAVEAVIDQTEDLGFSRLFNLSSMTVSNRAVALIVESGEACILTLTDTLTLSGNMTVTAPNCIIASNQEAGKGLIVSGSSDVTAGGLVAMADCYGCSDSKNVSVSTYIIPYALAPTKNPFADLDQLKLADRLAATYADGTCDTTKYSTGQMLPTYSNGGDGTGKAYCGQLHMTTGTDAVIFTPGVYVFYEADIQINGGTLKCSGCDDDHGVHIIQIDKTGQLDAFTINSAATVTLQAGKIIPDIADLSALEKAEFAGVLYYRTNDSQDKNGDEVVINGSSSTELVGGIYAPSSDMRFNGTSSSKCTVIVADSITLNGDTNLNQEDCPNIGLVPVKIRTIVMVE